MRFDKSKKHHLTVDQILEHIDSSGIAALDKMFMCGDYGDPAAGRHTLDIYRYFREINPEITLGMNTNGAIQNTAWWQTLGELFHRQQDYVVFIIDGLEDTNHIYRRGVIWEKLIENIRAYISTGASAHWDMLIYQHNEHQVDACQQLAYDLGFTWFRAKISQRPLTGVLQYPVGWSLPKTKHRSINCHALNEKSMYIDAHGRSSPCCWLGSRQVALKEFEIIQQSWKNNPNPICVRACGTEQITTNFDQQWQRNISLR
jgi:hypothetical protein